MTRLLHMAATATVAGLAAGTARAVYRGLRKHPPLGEAAWTRANHRGEPVSLLAGPAVATAATAAGLLAPGLPARARAALAVAGAGAAAFGGYDDLAGRGDRRGFRGHLGALAQGEVTTGAVKIAGIGAAGAVAAAVTGGSPTDVVINTGLVAGSANLVNLFDLRPGRAIKVALLGSALLAGLAPSARDGRARATAARALAGPAGAASGLLPEDLAERAMLGDAGANALGAMIGVAAASQLPRPARLALLAGIIGLTVASEVVSFTKVIERTPALRWLDMLGRRPAGQAGPIAPGNGGRGAWAARPAAGTRQAGGAGGQSSATASP